MANKLLIKQEITLVPIRFERAINGAPNSDFPEVDDRGHVHSVPEVDGLAQSSPIRGGVVGLGKEQEITVKMIRQDIDGNAPLYLTSSDKTVFTLMVPKEDDACASGNHTNIKIRGGNFAGSVPKSADIEVRYEASDGPIIAKLKVYTFAKYKVIIQPFTVTVDDPTGSGGTAPALSVSSLMGHVSALWACCGVELIVQSAQSFNIKLGQADQVMNAELNDVFAKKWEAGAINVYLVQALQNDTLGYGFSKSIFSSLGLTHPAVLLAMKSGTADRSSESYWCANDLAHELGHFFTLAHPSDGPATSVTWKRYETWSMRFLMHNYNYTGRPAIAHGISDWPDFNDFGYGAFGANPYRAGLISLKQVRAAGTSDGQCSAARNHIGKGPTSLY